MTGPAIAEAIVQEGQSLVDTITVGVGSGGTITGVGECVKAWTNDVQMVAVEPYECQALGGGLLGPHGIPDIGFGLVPDNYNPYVVDKIAAVASADAAGQPAPSSSPTPSPRRPAGAQPSPRRPASWPRAAAAPPSASSPAGHPSYKIPTRKKCSA